MSEQNSFSNEHPHDISSDNENNTSSLNDPSLFVNDAFLSPKKILLYDPSLSTNASIQTNEFSTTDEFYTTKNINAKELHFIPEHKWDDKYHSLEYLSKNYFSRKNNENSRFEHKLWNALQITSAFPQSFEFIGVAWVTNEIFKVHKKIFAQFNNIKCVNDSLFNKQGNFPTHGFIHASDDIIHQLIPEDQIQDLYQPDIVVFYHKDSTFRKDSNEDNINQCKYVFPRRQSRITKINMQQLNT